MKLREQCRLEIVIRISEKKKRKKNASENMYEKKRNNEEQIRWKGYKGR